MQRTEGRRLALLVGRDSAERSGLARALLDRGFPVFMCPGPPGCPLLREERCALVETADVAVLMPSDPAKREVAVGLSLCAERARRALILGRRPFDRRVPGTTVAGSTEPEAVAARVEALLWEGYASIG